MITKENNENIDSRNSTNKESEKKKHVRMIHLSIHITKIRTRHIKISITWCKATTKSISKKNGDYSQNKNAENTKNRSTYDTWGDTLRNFMVKTQIIANLKTKTISKIENQTI
ncbi:hypothetical protein CDIK_0367 [Cucumispora dikerogammari]|nr:hypothetical protein CDIK_0367 [Cucumispora dikerogammari]